MIENGLNNRISMHDCVVVKDELYFFTLNYNALYKANASGQLTFLGIAPNEKIYRQHLYGAIIYSNGYLFLPPMNAEEICVYNIETQSFYKLPLREKAEGVKSKFLKAVLYEEAVYMIPCRCHYIIKIDVDTLKVEYLDDFYKKMCISGQYNRMVFKNGCVLQNENLYLAGVYGNELVKINLKTMETDVFRIGEKKEGFYDMVCQGKEFLFLRWQSPSLIRWNIESKEYEEYEDLPEGFCSYGIPFIAIKDYGVHYYLVSFQSNMSVLFSKETEEMTQAEFDFERPQKCVESWDAKHYFVKRVDDDRLLVANIEDHSFDIVTENGTVKNFSLIDEGASSKLVIAAKRNVLERSSIMLKDFLETVISSEFGNTNQNTVTVGHETNGKRIHDIIIKDL